MENIDVFVASFLGGHRLRSFAQRPANGTKGGLLLLWDESAVRVTDIVTSEFYLLAMIHILSSDICFKIMTVYGPTASN